ncbi:putative quinol monooxygenase [Xenorhabdus anantnagensis]|uniref:Antibiotic biosynthesis monooxygenase n=1 Tax=Xenorhabdus anantnagensis TaxID=3025875 RepID=A0ABT5LQN9_9GAMM|nr:antibiotic biosynthesis monooxygenase [Xenorhabdus anantnagensis]MDC9596724.1 antibiotic biosynthesis monooxygenase [Xenorhabdus anantnagensis]
MYNNGYYVTAEIRANEKADLDIVVKELNVLQQKTLLEPGCEIFFIQQSRENPRSFIMWEKFIDHDSLNKHFEYEHTKYYLSLNLTDIVQVFTTDII